MDKAVLLVTNWLAVVVTAMITLSTKQPSPSFATGMTLLIVLLGINFYSNIKDITNE